jgi:hypothetical protein
MCNQKACCTLLKEWSNFTNYCGLKLYLSYVQAKSCCTLLQEWSNSIIFCVGCTVMCNWGKRVTHYFKNGATTLIIVWVAPFFDLCASKIVLYITSRMDKLHYCLCGVAPFFGVMCNPKACCTLLKEWSKYTNYCGLHLSLSYVQAKSCCTLLQEWSNSIFFLCGLHLSLSNVQSGKPCCTHLQNGATPLIIVGCTFIWVMCKRNCVAHYFKNGATPLFFVWVAPFFE